MANKKPTYIDFEAELMYARPFERNKDMGNGADIDYSEEGGRYSVESIITEEVKQDLINAGVPESQLGYDKFKPTGDGRFSFRTYRPHLNKYIMDEATGEPIVLGPPEVVDLNKPMMDEETGRKQYAPWNDEVNIGNGSKGRVKVQIIHGKRTMVRLLKIGVKELVEYEGSGDGF